MPLSERRDALLEFLQEMFKEALLMPEGEEIGLDENYFDLGLTSIRAVEIKQHLEDRLGCEVNITLMYSNPTLQALLKQLTDDALADLFPQSRNAPVDGARAVL
ncbi:acyl carrier protein [Streptosporangium sp. NPDC005286]|uniref:acyl carrier protein n=1 Tax=Streptosporangium sp. NPDC005286 TaxID=3154463 RepID=UPI0033A29692